MLITWVLISRFQLAPKDGRVCVCGILNLFVGSPSSMSLKDPYHLTWWICSMKLEDSSAVSWIEKRGSVFAPED